MKAFMSFARKKDNRSKNHVKRSKPGSERKILYIFSYEESIYVCIYVINVNVELFEGTSGNRKREIGFCGG
jgi:hypothetical protein